MDVSVITGSLAEAVIDRFVPYNPDRFYDGYLICRIHAYTSPTFAGVTPPVDFTIANRVFAIIMCKTSSFIEYIRKLALIPILLQNILISIVAVIP